MITLTKIPPEFAFVEEGLQVEAESDLAWQGDDVKASVDLLFPSVQGNYADKYFDLEFMGEVRRFTFKATPDTSGQQLRSWVSGEAKDVFITKVITDLRANFYLSSNYSFNTLPADAGIGIQAIKPGDAYDIEMVASNLTDFAQANKIDGHKEQMPDGYRVYFALRNDKVQKNSVYQIFAQELAPINANGIAKADFKAYAKGLPKIGLTFPANLAPNNTEKHYEGIVPARIVYAEHYEGNVRKMSVSEVLNIVPGGLGTTEKNIVKDAFGFDANTRFLTWAPNPKRTVPDAFERLYFHILENYFLVKATITQFDGTQTTIILGDTDEPATYEIPCGLAEITDIDPETVSHYTVALYQEGETVPASEIFEFRLDHKPRYKTRHFIYKNSFGVYENVTLWGEMTEGTQYTRIQKEVMTGQGYKITPFKNERLNTYKISSGYITEKEKRWMQELLLSKDVFWVENGWLFPVVITNTEAEPLIDKVFTHSIEVEFTLDVRDERYSILTSYLPGTHHLVSFDTQGGSFIAPLVVKHGQKATRPADPIKAGAEFFDWYKGEDLYDFDTVVTESFSLVANWSG